LEEPANLTHSVRVPDCDSGSDGFESRDSPNKNYVLKYVIEISKSLWHKSQLGFILSKCQKWLFIYLNLIFAFEPTSHFLRRLFLYFRGLALLTGGIVVTYSAGMGIGEILNFLEDYFVPVIVDCWHDFINLCHGDISSVSNITTTTPSSITTASSPSRLEDMLNTEISSQSIDAKTSGQSDSFPKKDVRINLLGIKGLEAHSKIEAYLFYGCIAGVSLVAVYLLTHLFPK
jgi:hypothetical protein